MKRTYVVVRKPFVRPEAKEQETTFSRIESKRTHNIDSTNWFTNGLNNMRKLGDFYET